MVWANRTTDVRPPLVDFENLDGWTVACVDAEASFQRSRQQQLWGQYVGALVYRGTGKKPTVVLKPPKPIPVSGPFNCVNLWVYGNNWSYGPDPKTPPVEIAVLLRGRNGSAGAGRPGPGRLAGVVAHAPPFDGRAVGPAQRRREPGGDRGVRRSERRGPQAVFRQPGHLPGSVAAAEVREAAGAAVRSVSGRNARRERRARATALSHPAANHPARQSHGGVQDGAGAVGQQFRVPLSRARTAI